MNFKSIDTLREVIGTTSYGAALPKDQMPTEANRVNTRKQFEKNIAFLCDHIREIMKMYEDESSNSSNEKDEEEESEDDKEEEEESEDDTEKSEESEEEESESEESKESESEEESQQEQNEEKEKEFELYIGSTGVKMRVRVNKVFPKAFDPLNPSTWRVSGPGTLGHRFHSTHKKFNSTVIAVMCFGSRDIPRQMTAHMQDQRQLSLCYESAISQAMRRQLLGTKGTKWAFRGTCFAGGKQSNKAPAGSCVYIAINRIKK